MVVGFPINVFISIITTVVVVVPGTDAAVMGAGMGADVAMVVGHDAKSFVFADGVGEGTLPMAVLTGTTVETVVPAGALRPRMVRVDGIAMTAFVAVASGLAGRGRVVPGMFFVMELWHGGPVRVVGEPTDEETVNGFSSIRVAMEGDDGGIGEVGMGTSAHLCGSELLADRIDGPAV
jgi:hypothetical protein